MSIDLKPGLLSSLCAFIFFVLLVPCAGAQGRWTTETRLPNSTQEISVAALNGQVWVAAGSLNQARTNALWSYDPATGLWTPHAPYPGTARDHAGIAVVGNFIYLIGGVTAWPAPSVATAQKYDPSTNTWTAIAPLPVARGAMGIAVINGKIYAAGGLEAGSSVNDFTVYDPATNSWTTLPDMPTARDHLTGAAIGGKFYAIGGRVIGQTCSPMNIVEIFDPTTNTWAAGTPMLMAHAGHATGTVNGHIQVFGGEGSPGNCGTVSGSEDFDPSTNTWKALPNMPTPRHGIGGATIGTNVYLPGGATWTGDSATAAHERYDSTGTSTSGAAPAPWTARDIGAVTVPGTTTYDTGVFFTQVAGANIWSTADAFHFIYQPLTGDGQIVARVDALGFTDAHAKAGIMIRESTAAGSRHVTLDSQPDNSTELTTRSTTNGTTVKITGDTTAEPVWLRLVRSGSTITASVGTDGGTWKTLGQTTLSLPSTVLVGLAVTSHSSKATSATIDHVAVTPAGSGNQPPIVSLTSPADGATFTAPATISLSASASDADGSVARVDFFANGSQVGTSTGPFAATWSNVAVGSYTITAVATDNGGAQTTSSAVSITVTSGSTPDALPSPWTHGDIGAVGLAGSSSFSNGVFTVKGAGTDIWGAEDSFQFAYQPLNGDGEIVARVATIQAGDQWAKAGVMIRNSLDANSAFGMMLVTPVASNGVRFQSRTRAGLTATRVVGAAATAPYWVKVVRAGSVVTGYQSSNGSTWVAVGNATLTLAPSIFIGLAVDSHNTSALETATFDNVTVTSSGGGVTPGLPSPWTDQDVGSTGKAGAATFANNTFTVTAAGANIWGTADSFNLLNVWKSGDSSIVARVTALQNTADHAKAGVMFRESSSEGSRDVILDYEPTGRIELMTRASTNGTTATIANSTATLPVWLRLVRSGSTVTASLSPNGATWTQVGTMTTSIPSNMAVGMATSSHTTSATTTATYDNVTTTGAAGTPVATDPGTISFSRKTIVMSGMTPSGAAVAIPNFQSPTSLALGPDGKLYASVLTGRLFIFTLDPTKLSDPAQIAVTDAQEIDNIYNRPSIVCDSNGLNCQEQPTQGRQVTGIAIDPSSTPANIVLYVTHSGLSKAKTDMTLYTYGGALTRLTLRPDPANAAHLVVVEDQDLIVGLPRSREAHTVNGMDFGPDGWLYIAVGGNTNAGAPSTFFANLAEAYLSASVLRLNLANLNGQSLPLDVTSVRAAADLTQYTGLFEQFATGYRNPYDIAWHSNGRLYLNGNAPNLNQGNTPGSADGCSTPSIDVGTKPDTLNIVTQGAFGGHPNPTHGQCVWGDGTAYSPALTPEKGWVKPIGNYSAPSADGLVEYKSNAFNGAMKGNLLSANYAGDQNLRQVILTADGSGVASMKNLAQFSNPLDVVADLSGVIYVAEFGASYITLLVPAQISACPVPNSDPAVTDSDKDGYTDYDERANGSDPCSAASTPPDFNHNGVSDLLDNDDDSDGIADASDQLYLDAQNGAATTLPLALEWNPGDGDYGRVEHSGFTGVQISTNAAKDQASGHALNPAGIHPGDAGGHLTMWTYPGTAEGSTNSQVNALQIGFDSSTAFRIWSRITQPFTGATPALGHVGGIFFGPDEDNYVRLALVGTSTGGQALQLALEVGGAFAEKTRIDLTGTAISNLDVFLIGDPVAHTIAAYRDVNTTGAMTPIGAPVTVPASWFSDNTAAARNTSLTGLMASDGGAAQMAFVYDFFRVDRSVP